MSLETSGSSSARSMLTWVSVRQKEGGRGVGGSVNQNNTLSWCEIKLLTSCRPELLAHTFTHSSKNCCYLCRILPSFIFLQGCFVLPHIPVWINSWFLLSLSLPPPIHSSLLFFLSQWLHRQHTRSSSLTLQHIKGDVRLVRRALPIFLNIPGVPTANRNSAGADKTHELQTPDTQQRKDTQEERDIFFKRRWLTEKRQSSRLLVDYQRSCMRAGRGTTSKV